MTTACTYSNDPNPNVVCPASIDGINVGKTPSGDCSVWSHEIIPPSFDTFADQVWTYATPEMRAIANGEAMFKNSYTHILLYAFYGKMIDFYNQFWDTVKLVPNTGGSSSTINIRFVRWLDDQAADGLTDPHFFFPDNDTLTGNLASTQIANTFGATGQFDYLVTWMRAFNATLKAYASALLGCVTQSGLSGVQASHLLTDVLGASQFTDDKNPTATVKTTRHLTFDNMLSLDHAKAMFQANANATYKTGGSDANAPLLSAYCQTYANFGTDDVPRGWTRTDLLTQGDNRSAITLCGCFLKDTSANYPSYANASSASAPDLYKDAIGCSTLCNNDFALQNAANACNASYCVLSNITINASNYSTIDGNINITNNCDCSGGGADATCQCVIDNTMVNFLPGAVLNGNYTIGQDCTITSGDGGNGGGGSNGGGGTSPTTLQRFEVWGGVALLVSGIGLAGVGLLAHPKA